ncbi:MAG: hypothetical protein RL033_6446 [Pseudomonadota bacterium]|jgi:hypothetical protein
MSDETSVTAGSPATVAERRQGARRSQQRAPARRARRGIVLTALGVLLAGCVYDENDRCSPGQIPLGEGLCVCPQGSVLAQQGCTVCGENEVSAGRECVCGEGFSRPAAGGACEEAPSGLGVSCTGATCADPAFPLCASASDGSGYCTRQCTSTANCDGGYLCDTAAASAYCQRPPLGAGRACTSDADCAGTEATFCESFMLHQCVVRDCSPAAQDCFGDNRCCDLTQFGVPAPICLPNGAC